MSEKGLIFAYRVFLCMMNQGAEQAYFLQDVPFSVSGVPDPESWIKKKHIMIAENVCKWENGSGHAEMYVPMVQSNLMKMESRA